MLTPDNFQILYLNLDRDTYKSTLITSFLNQLPFDYRRVSAIEPDRFEWSWKDVDLNFKDHTSNDLRNISRGELGCMLSHLDMWQDVLNSGKITLILEDDAISDYDVDDLIREIMWVKTALDDSEYDFCYMGRQPLQAHKETDIEIMRGLIEPRYSWLTHAYMITPRGANRLLDIQMEIEKLIPVDEFIPYAISAGMDEYIQREYEPVKNPIKALAHVDAGLFYQNRNQNTVSTTEPGQTGGCSVQYYPYDLNGMRTITRLVTVATDDENPGYVSLINSGIRHEWNFDLAENLGEGVTWNGGDMIAPGGGQKINLLKQAFDEGKFDEDDIIIFVDGHDVGLCAKWWNVVNRWLDNFDPTKVLFAAEAICWPDNTMADMFPPSPTPYRFLNSGTFMGRAKIIKRLLDEIDIDNSEDDQAAYQGLFLSGLPIELDYECRIFQPIHGALEHIEYDPVSGNIYNKVTKTAPQIIHGNGPSKDVWENLMKIMEERIDPPRFEQYV